MLVYSFLTYKAAFFPTFPELCSHKMMSFITVDATIGKAVLSEEARACLQQNSKAQLKKQQKRSKQKATPAPIMKTKAVSTVDLEDSSSNSTGSSVTTDGQVSFGLHGA